ncbi:MAG: radical SAM protein [Oscillospiraceae bacterium]|nr:radical SAM protein [Oscillospiraceae bacterium]
MKIAFYTLGCKVNNSETEGFIRQFAAAGWEVVPFNDAADVYVVNSCAVTGMAEAKSRKAVNSRQLTVDSEDRKPIIAVIGCASQLGKSKFNADIILGTENRHELFAKVTETFVGATISRPAASGDKIATFQANAVRPYNVGGRTRKIIKIQDGCENFCAYCIIPHARGKEKSRAVSEILEEIGANPSSEIVLVGIHVSSWQLTVDGRQLRLLDLVEEILKIDGVHRVRLGSLEPHDMDEEFVNRAAELCGEKKRTPPSSPLAMPPPLNRGGILCPHFHISLQSGSDSVLARMGRKYNFDRFYAIVKNLKEKIPNCAITTDIIAGFGGETEAEFKESYRNIEKCEFAKIHIFPYSERQGTTGASKEFIQEHGSVPSAERKKRAKILGELADRAHNEFLQSQVGAEQEIVWEKNGGYTPNYTRVKCEEGNFESGDIVKVKIMKSDGEKCFGEIM